MRASLIFTFLATALLSSAAVLERGEKEKECCFQYVSYWVTTGTITTLGIASKTVDITIHTCEKKWD